MPQMSCYYLSAGYHYHRCITWRADRSSYMGLMKRTAVVRPRREAPARLGYRSPREYIAGAPVLAGWLKLRRPLDNQSAGGDHRFAPPGSTTGLMMVRALVCRSCRERDGVVEHQCTNERMGKDFTAFVCAPCVEAGRQRRVTCRTFIPSTS